MPLFGEGWQNYFRIADKPETLVGLNAKWWDFILGRGMCKCEARLQ
jgi:hypothetical protein